MKSADVIIIGAGAAGMMTAYELVKAGKKILVLEARDRPGGRIYTVDDPAFHHPLEAGAEYIHGNLPVTMKLLKEGKISYYTALGKNWIYKEKTLRQGEDFVEHWDVLMSRVKEVKKDMPLAVFLNEYLPEPEYATLRRSVSTFVEGYDAADPVRTSTLSMKAEWSNEDQWDQHRAAGGYGKLISYLYEQCKEAGAVFRFSTIAKQVKWMKDNVEVTDEKGNVYKASKAVIAVPLGILQADSSVTASIAFTPAPDEKLTAIKTLGYGSVTKMLLQFDIPFWNERIDEQGNKMSEMGYLFSDCKVPTWWTQYPNISSVLTGWVAGPKAATLKEASNESILEDALNSLAEIFSMEKELLKKKLTAWRIFNWTADPFTLGAYSYPTLGSAEAKKILMRPEEDTLFFAGEALGQDNQTGTVDIALQSGKAVAAQILKS